MLVTRFVVRSPLRCDYCPWTMREYDSGYARVVGGVAIGRYCNLDHATRSTRGPVAVVYGDGE